MLSLPDLCLIPILENLNIKDQLNCAKAHSRFRLLLREVVWRRKSFPRHAFAEHYVYHGVYDEIFSLNTEYMEELTIIYDYFDSYSGWRHTDIEKCAKFYYPKLRFMKVHFDQLGLTLIDFPFTRRQCPNLTSLEFNGFHTELHFGKPNTEMMPSTLQVPATDCRRYKSVESYSTKEEVVEIQKKCGLSIQMYVLKNHDYENLQSDNTVSVNEMGIFFRFPWRPYAPLSFINVKRLHLSFMTPYIWDYLEGCPNVESIFFYYPVNPTESEQNNLVAFLDEVLYGTAKGTFDRQPNEKVIRMYFRRITDSLMDRLIKDKGSLTVCRKQKYYRFEYFFDEDIDKIKGDFLDNVDFLEEW